jgi:hypothetical protein
MSGVNQTGSFGVMMPDVTFVRRCSMSAIRILLLIPALSIAACASAPEQYASRECKIVPATFINTPTKDPTPAERAEAQLRMQRFAYSRGSYNLGNDMPSQALRDCY